MLFLLHFHFSLHTQRTPRWTYSTVLPLMHSTYVLRALLCDCSTACREEGFLQVNSMHSSLQTGLCESTKTLQPLLQLSWWLNKVSFCLTVHPRWIQPLWKYSQNNPQLNHFSLAPGLPHFQISFSLNLTSLSSVHLHWQPATILTHPSAQLPLPKPLLLSTISPCQELPERQPSFPSPTLQWQTSQPYSLPPEHSTHQACVPPTEGITFLRQGCTAMRTNHQPAEVARLKSWSVSAGCAGSHNALDCSSSPWRSNGVDHSPAFILNTEWHQSAKIVHVVCYKKTTKVAYLALNTMCKEHLINTTFK